MFSKLLLIAALGLTSTVAFSQDAKKDAKTEEKKEVVDLSNQNFAYTAFDYIKKTMTASYHGEYYFTRPNIASANPEDHNISDLKIMHNPTVIYRPADKWRLLATGEFKYTDAKAKGSFVNGFYRALVSVTREKIMTEKEDGMGLSVGIARRIFNHTKSPPVTSYGNSRINATMSKTLAGKHPASIMFQYLHNDPIESKKAVETTWEHGFNLLPTITFQITDKISYLFNDDFIINTPEFDQAAQDYTLSHDMNIAYITYQWDDKNATYFQYKYVHSDTFAEDNDTSDTFSYFVGHTYSFTPKASITLEVGSDMYQSKDGKDGFADTMKYPEYAVYLDLAI